MTRTARRATIGIAIAAAAALLAGLLLAPLANVDRYRQRAEADASRALGMTVRIDGPMRLRLLPRCLLTLEGGRVLGAGGDTVASAQRLVFQFDPLAALLGRLRMRRLEVTAPVLALQRDRQGRFNVGDLRRAGALLPALDGATVAITNGAVRFQDRHSGVTWSAAGLDVRVKRLRFRGPWGRGVLARTTLDATVACARIGADERCVTDLTCAIRGGKGVFDVAPIGMRALGGLASGSLRLDLSGQLPACRVRCSLPRFRGEDLAATLSTPRAVRGELRFTLDVLARGSSVDECVRSATGQVSLRGEDLVLEGSDLDRQFARFESSQNFSLLDAGAVFFAGPFGAAVTKGVDFANLFRRASGSTRIRALVSDWTLARGEARATDVALATASNRLALQGRVDLVHASFADVTVAVLDPGGCARVRQRIRGPFARPVVEKPRIFVSLAGPALRVVQRTRALFPGAPCVPFYSGSVAPPR